MKSTTEGCILINDINCFLKKKGGNKSNSISLRFTDLGIPVGFLSNRITNQCKTYKDETNIEPISEKTFNYFINKMLP